MHLTETRKKEKRRGRGTASTSLSVRLAVSYLPLLVAGCWLLVFSDGVRLDVWCVQCSVRSVERSSGGLRVLGVVESMESTELVFRHAL